MKPYGSGGYSNGYRWEQEGETHRIDMGKIYPKSHGGQRFVSWAIGMLECCGEKSRQLNINAIKTKKTKKKMMKKVIRYLSNIT